MQSDGPKKYNIARTDEVMREAACAAAQAGIKLIEGGGAFDAPRLAALGDFIDGCAGGMLFPDDNNSSTPDFDND